MHYARVQLLWDLDFRGQGSSLAYKLQQLDGNVFLLPQATGAAPQRLHAPDAVADMPPQPSASAVRMLSAFPSTKCEHVEACVSDHMTPMDMNAPCSVCGAAGDNWVCLTCGQVFCGRNASSHVVDHFHQTQSDTPRGHALSLHFGDLTVWCLICDRDVVHRALQPVLQLAHQSRFGTPMPSGLVERMAAMFNSMLQRPATSVACLNNNKKKKKKENKKKRKEEKKSKKGKIFYPTDPLFLSCSVVKRAT